MIFANVGGRAAVGVPGRLVDLELASGGRFPADPMAVLECWDDMRSWYARSDVAAVPTIEGRLEAPVPWPRQVFGIGINYADHATESGLESAASPLVFIKLATSIAGPEDPLPVCCSAMDWEVELVVVIGRRCTDVPEDDAWSAVAGLMIGQDISDRVLQLRPPSPPQFSLGKSRPGFGPTGPWIVSPDAFDRPDDLAISCRLNGEEVQNARTSNLIFGVRTLVAYLSSLVTLLPGDLIFTGTPAGIGMTREPPVYLQAGDVLLSTIEGVGTLTTNVVAPE